MYFDYAAATPVDKKVLVAMLPYFSDRFYNPSAAYGAARDVRADYLAAKHRIAQVIGAKPGEIIMTAGATESINLAFQVVKIGSSTSTHQNNSPEHAVEFRDEKPSSRISESPQVPALENSNQEVFSGNSKRIQWNNSGAPSDLGSASFILTTPVEHQAVLSCAAVKVIPVDEFGRISVENLREYISPMYIPQSREKDEQDSSFSSRLSEYITDDIKLISIGYANNEIGTVQPIKEVAEVVAEVRAERAKKGIKTPIYLHTDASQAAGLLDINVAWLGVDMMTLNAGKCYGPKQVGCLYVRAGVKLSPLIRGGGQEMGLRSGTENVAGAVGFAVALEIAEKKRKSEIRRLEALRDDLEKYITTVIARSVTTKQSRLNESTAPITDGRASEIDAGQARITMHAAPSTKSEGSGAVDIREETQSGSLRYARDDIVVNGHKKHRLPNILNFSVPGLDAERAVFALDQRGVQVATGSACAANKGTRSHVLTAIGLTPELADGSIRISMGRGTTKAQIEKLKPILKEVITTETNLS